MLDPYLYLSGKPFTILWVNHTNKVILFDLSETLMTPIETVHHCLREEHGAGMKAGRCTVYKLKGNKKKSVNRVAGDEINSFGYAALQHILTDLTSGSNTASNISAFQEAFTQIAILV